MLREQMRTSRLCDGVTFTREFEALLRGVWQTWCARGR
jgi:predicted O-linked N-acetylglucosamine transferase (SPINDLY family)